MILQIVNQNMEAQQNFMPSSPDPSLSQDFLNNLEVDERKEAEDDEIMKSEDKIMESKEDEIMKFDEAMMVSPQSKQPIRRSSQLFGFTSFKKSLNLMSSKSSPNKEIDQDEEKMKSKKFDSQLNSSPKDVSRRARESLTKSKKNKLETEKQQQIAKAEEIRKQVHLLKSKVAPSQPEMSSLSPPAPRSHPGINIQDQFLCVYSF